MLDKEMGTEAGKRHQLGSPDGSPCVSIKPLDLSQDFSPCLDLTLCRITNKVWGWSVSRRMRQTGTHMQFHTYTQCPRSVIPEWLKRYHLPVSVICYFYTYFWAADVPVETHADIYSMYFSWAKFSCTFGEKMLLWLQSFITVEASALLRNSELELQQWGRNHNSSKIQQLCPENFTCENTAVTPVTDWLPATTMQCLSAYTAVVVEETYESLHGWFTLFFICLDNKELWLSLVSSGALIGKDTGSKVSPV